MSVPTRARRRPNDGLPEQPTGTWAFTGLPAVTRSELIVNYLFAPPGFRPNSGLFALIVAFSALIVALLGKST